MTTFPEHLAERVDATGSGLCVGLDPRFDWLPKFTLPTAMSDQAMLDARIAAYERFCHGVIEAVADLCPAVKPQIAFFEQLGPKALLAFERICCAARRRGLAVIVDAKRSDISTTAEAYAESFFPKIESGRRPFCDALTVNPFFGRDGLEPFIKTARSSDAGLFILVKTSNPSSAELQDLSTPDGTVSEVVADLIAKLEPITEGPYGLIGAVVGATQTHVIPKLRRRMPRSWFLLPGVGAQGGTMADAAMAFDAEGHGALVNVSRSVLFPWRTTKDATVPTYWQDAVRAAAICERDLLRDALRASSR